MEPTVHVELSPSKVHSGEGRISVKVTPCLSPVEPTLEAESPCPDSGVEKEGPGGEAPLESDALDGPNGEDSGALVNVLRRASTVALESAYDTIASGQMLSPDIFERLNRTDREKLNQVDRIRDILSSGQMLPPDLMFAVPDRVMKALEAECSSTDSLEFFDDFGDLGEDSEIQFQTERESQWSLFPVPHPVDLDFVNIREFALLCQNVPGIVVLDVRSTEKWRASHIENSICVPPYSELMEDFWKKYFFGGGKVPNYCLRRNLEKLTSSVLDSDSETPIRVLIFGDSDRLSQFHLEAIQEEIMIRLAMREGSWVRILRRGEGESNWTDLRKECEARGIGIEVGISVRFSFDCVGGGENVSVRVRVGLSSCDDEKREIEEEKESPELTDSEVLGKLMLSLENPNEEEEGEEGEGEGEGEEEEVPFIPRNRLQAIKKRGPSKARLVTLDSWTTYNQLQEFPFMVIDTRSHSRWVKSHLRAAVNVPPYFDLVEEFQKGQDERNRPLRSCLQKFATRGEMLKFFIYGDHKHSSHLLCLRETLSDELRHQREGTIFTIQDYTDFARRYDSLITLEDRRSTSHEFPAEIIPNFLFLGSKPHALSRTILNGIGITHIVNCAEELAHFFETEYIYCPILGIPDTAEDSLEPIVTPGIEFIHTASAIKDSRVFVHCNMGISRSSSVVIAYIMRYVAPEATFDEVRQWVKSKRSCVKPNDGFKVQLDALQKKWQSERQEPTDDFE